VTVAVVFGLVVVVVALVAITVASERLGTRVGPEGDRDE
jgi:hypothetical protein